MKKKNCWEEKKCGREPGGENAKELGICPAADPSEFNGTNGGTCGGRYCWKITGTLCDGEKQGKHTSKIMKCSHCEFFHKVRKEEGKNFVL